MVTRRTAIWLVALASAMLLPGTAAAQIPADSNLQYQTPNPTYENGSAPFANATPTKHRPLLPVGPLNVEPDWDLFAPAETSGFGNGPRPRIGWFGSYERLFWSLSKPDTTVIGSQTANGVAFLDLPLLDINTTDTSFIGGPGAWGNRYDLGYYDTDNYGWMVSVVEHVSQAQYEAVQNANVRFDFLTETVLVNSVPLFVGRVPQVFATLDMKNVVLLNSVELTRMYRAPRLHNGGLFELLYGVRWFQIDDAFSVRGTSNAGLLDFDFNGDPATIPLNLLGNATWNTRSINNLIGPQIGVRLSQQRERWISSLEARFLAAANLQNTFQITDSSNAQFVFRPIGGRTHEYRTTFAPMGELRANLTCQATSSVGLKVGYTGIVAGNISRASNRVDYGGPRLISIANSGWNQIFFVNGVSFGVEINR